MAKMTINNCDAAIRKPAAAATHTCTHVVSQCHNYSVFRLQTQPCTLLLLLLLLL